MMFLFQIQNFLQFVKDIYKELPSHMNKIFEPKPQIKIKDITDINMDQLLSETYTITTILTDKKNQDNQSISVRYIENNVCTRVANCLCAHERVILMFISRVALQRGK